tara:strand:+ start:3475 stop:4305 length:831 start_codon:yes stop_codon:yes gene_type:complete
MHVVSSKEELYEFINLYQNEKKKITLIPTMGNLHEGHIKLIKRSPLKSIKLVTIYVNKLQFDNNNDYINYPRTLDNDIDECKKSDVDLVFIPDSNFSNNLEKYNDIKLPEFTNYMCGKTRNGHFIGVYKIVRNFFNMIKPDYACFGMKDYQQLLLIKHIAIKYFQNLKIIDVDTVRDNNNIALSSRLKRIPPHMMINVEEIYNTLYKFKSDLLKGDKYSETYQIFINKLESSNIEVEYLEHRMNDSLELANNNIENSSLFIACKIDKVRLIDNIQI